MTSVLIIYDTGDGTIIYQADVDEYELEKLKSIHNKYGGTVGTSDEDDQLISEIDTYLTNCSKIFDSSDSKLSNPISNIRDIEYIFVTGYVM